MFSSKKEKKEKRNEKRNMSGDEGMAVSTQRGESFYNVYVYPFITLHMLEFCQFYVKKGRKKEKKRRKRGCSRRDKGAG